MTPATALAPAFAAEVSKAAILSLPSTESRRLYTRAIDNFVTWLGARPFDRRNMLEYRGVLQEQRLSTATINVYLSAIKHAARELFEQGSLAQESYVGVKGVKGLRHQYAGGGQWLTTEQTRALLLAPNKLTASNLRDRAVLGLLVGCGLRRSELVRLTWEHFAISDQRIIIKAIKGKGDKPRSIAVPDWLWTTLNQWGALSGTQGLVVRSVISRRTQGDMIRDTGLCSAYIHHIVSKWGSAIGVDGLAPHDLRRTIANLAREAGAPLEQIQMMLGHESILTTERYLNAKQDFKCAPVDLVNLAPVMDTV